MQFKNINGKQNSKSKKFQKSVPKRIPNKLLKKIEKRGNGDFRAGLYKMDSLCDIMENDPSLPICRELDTLGQIIKAVAPDNHDQHYVDSGLPRLLLKFAKTGKVDKNILWSNKSEKNKDSSNGDKKNG